MYNIKDYFDEDNKISRMKIARDIKSCKLTKEDLDELVKNENVKSVFIGSKFESEVDKEKWTKEYLMNLYYMAIGESFNEEYLFHLCEVAEYVNQPKEKNKIIGIAVIIVALGALGTVIYSWLNTSKGCTGNDCPEQTAHLMGRVIYNWFNTKIGS